MSAPEKAGASLEAVRSWGPTCLLAKGTQFPAYSGR